MKKYIFRRVLQIIPILLILSFIVFILVHVAGDPVALMLPEDATEEDRQAMREALNLDKPLIVQYGTFLTNILKGDFGDSFRYRQSALPLVLERLPATFELAAASMLVAVLIAIPFGIWSATRQNSFTDLFITGGAVIGKAMPNFWLGIMLIMFFAVQLKWFPVSGRGDITNIILPSITLGTGIAAEMTRLIRSSMLEVLQQDYIRTARSKGLKDRTVIYLHAFRNTLIPVVTMTSIQITHLIGGAIVTETVFSWPGIGQLLVQAVNGRDMAIVQASVFVIAFMVIVINLLTDIIYRLLDPRVKYN